VGISPHPVLNPADPQKISSTRSELHGNSFCTSRAMSKINSEGRVFEIDLKNAPV
jgi:hypothetical protein